MATYENLGFSDLTQYSMKNEKTGKTCKIVDVIDAHLDDVRKKVKQNGGSGELVIKFKFSKGKEDGLLEFYPEVKTKLPTAKNKIDLYQDEKGMIYMNQPNQQALAGIHPIGTSSNRKEG